MISPGTPTTSLLSGISLVTTVPAPITTLFPIFTFGKIVQFPPKLQLFPTCTLPSNSALGEISQNSSCCKWIRPR